MVQAKTSDFQPLPLKILNVLSLLAGASLLVAVSWEILLGDPRHYSTDYLLLQGIVCVVFFWPISLPGCGWLTTVGVFSFAISISFFFPFPI